MSVKMPREPHHTGENASTRGVGSGKSRQVAGSKKNTIAGKKVAGSKRTISGKRSVSKSKTSVSKA